MMGLSTWATALRDGQVDDVPRRYVERDNSMVIFYKMSVLHLVHSE